MKSSILAIGLILSSAIAAAESKPVDCLDRVRAEGCYVGARDYREANRNVEKCRRVMSLGAKEKLEVFLLKSSEKVVVIQSRGPAVTPPYCPAVRYEIDNSGAADIKIINHHVFILSNDGQLYMMEPNGAVLEVLSTAGTPYKSLVDVKQGRENVRNVLLIGRTFETELTPEELDARKKRRVRFTVRTTRESLFSDN